MQEFPLVIFTVFSQLAVGAIVTLWVLDVFSKNISLTTGKIISGSIIIITALSLLGSLFHLGHPLNAYRAITHIQTSWLSREVLLFGVFLFATVFYYLQWKADKEKSRKTIGTITSIIGVAGVISSGMLYVMPSMPAWNNFSPIIFFLLTAALLGPIYVGTIVMITSKKEVANLPIIIGGTLGAYLITYTVYLSVLLSSDATSNLTGLNIINSNTFWLRITLSFVLPFIMLIVVYLRKQKYGMNFMLITLLLFIIGEIIGRESFYSSIVGLQINGLF